MIFMLRIKTAVLLCFACFILAVTASAQDSGLGHLAEVPELGEIRGITSFHDFERRFLGVWYYVKESNQVPSGENLLVIFERKQSKFNEVFRFNSAPTDGAWERLLPLYPSRLTGLILSASQISGDDDVRLIVLVSGKFKVVHHGSSSEFWDINDDGFPEIFDSIWPDGDGNPETTTVYIWDGKSYRSLIKVRYSSRLDNRVRNAVDKASRRFRPKAPK